MNPLRPLGLGLAVGSLAPLLASFMADNPGLLRGEFVGFLAAGSMLLWLGRKT